MMLAIAFILGLAALAAGAELLVAGTSRLAARLGISPLVIGLTVVAFGTSAPELGVSLQSVFAGEGTIALGNVVGSNICNVLLILGAAAIITPLSVSIQLIRFDVPLMIVASLVVWALAADGSFGRVDGTMLFLALLVYTGWLLKIGRRSQSPTQDTESEASATLAISVVKAVVGLALLILGARWLVASAVEMAIAMGISKQVVGLTVVAVGTSLPEAVTSIVASLRGERDMAIGNVVGSNLFNLLGVLGLSAAVSPQPLVVPGPMLVFDLPIMCLVAVSLLPVCITGALIARWEGALLLGYFATYTAYLVMGTQNHPAQQTLANVVLYVALPLTGLLLAATCWHWYRTPR